MSGVLDRKNDCRVYYYPSPNGESDMMPGAFERTWYPRLLESLAYEMLEWESQRRKWADQVENVSLLRDSTEAVTDSWQSAFWLLFWLQFHLDDALDSYHEYSNAKGDDAQSQAISRLMFHVFVAQRAALRVKSLPESRFSYLHMGARLEVERVFYGEMAPFNAFSSEDERWLLWFLSAQPRHAVFSHADLIETPAGKLVFERFRVVVQHCPCESGNGLASCLKHFLYSGAPRLRRSIHQCWINAGSLSATYFGARMRTITDAELWTVSTDG